MKDNCPFVILIWGYAGVTGSTYLSTYPDKETNQHGKAVLTDFIFLNLVMQPVPLSYISWPSNILGAFLCQGDMAET